MAVNAEQVRILLVEDDDGDALLVEELLNEAGTGVAVQRARMLADARKLIPGAACVLLDLGLPDSQGLDGLRWLLRQEPDVTIVVLTGVADEYLGEEAVRAGAQDYLVKGDVTGQMLHRVIRYAMERRRWSEDQRQLQAAQARAQENARLERGLLPSPVLGRRQAAASRRGLLRRGADPGRLGARADRRCLRARPFRGRARRQPAGGMAGPGAGRPASV
jgi:FixJ family two-component response regulator